MRTIEFCSVLFGALVDDCHKQDSLMRGGLRDKQTSTLSVINYSTLKLLMTVHQSSMPKPKIASFAYPTYIRFRRPR